METYCVSCKKILSEERTKQNRLTFLSNYAVGGKKKSRFIKNQDIFNI